jgi:hypothetical protein
MNEPGHQRWHRAALLLGVLYLVAGLAFGALAGRASSSQMRVTWRLLAWLISGAGFASHIGYEHFRLRNPPVRAALHASLAVALGAFGLAVAANVHALRSGSSHRGALALAIVLWPVLTAMPAFLVALALAALLAVRRRGV